MTLFWAGIGAGAAGISLIVWTLMRAGKAADDWLAVFGPLEAPAPARARPRRPYNYSDDLEAFADIVRAELAALPTTKEPAA